MKRFVAGLLLLGGLLVAGGATAAAVFTIQQVGADVRVTASGTLITNGLTLGATFGPGYGSLRPNPASIIVGPPPSSGVNYDFYTDPISGPSSFGSANGNLGATSAISPASIVGFYKFQGIVFTPVGFISGSTISGSSTFAGESFASLGLTDGSTYTYTLANNETITVIIGSPSAPSAVPSLSEWAQLMLALMVICIAWHFHNNRQNSY